MTVLDPDQGITLNVGTDPANLPSQQNSEFAGLLSRLNLRYANEAARTANHPASVEGEESHLAAEDRKEIYDSASWISLAHRSVYAYLRRTTDAAAINNSVALVSDAVMTSALAAAATYTFKGTLIYDCSTVADVKVAIAWPGGANGKSYFHGLAPGAATLDFDARYALATASASTFGFGGLGVGTIGFLKFEGRVTTVGAGNLVVQYAQQNLEATNLTIRADSYLEVIRRS